MLILSGQYRLAIYNNDLIILDIDLDSFSVISDAREHFLENTTTLEFRLFMKEYFKCNEPYKILKPDFDNNTFLEIRWLRPISDAAVNGIFNRVHSYLLVRHCKKIIDNKGFQGVIRYLFNYRTKKHIKYNETSKDDIMEAISLANLSFNMFKIENPCLVYSLVLTRILIDMSINAKVIIGVRTSPFFSHAWVEVAGKVIGDDADLRRKLCVILEI